MKNSLDILVGIISEKFGVDGSQINPNANLRDDLNLSKIEIIDLIEMLTSKFNISMPEDLNIESLSTVSDVLNLIEQQSTEI